MKNFAASPAVPSVLPERMSDAVAPMGAAPAVSAGEERTLFSADVAHVVRRSVESAVAAAEQFATGEKRAVTLQFSVSGVDLGVRVELRSGGVHTTFRTDSPELRAALAQEWQSFTAAQPTERPLRLAEPVFTSNGNGASTGSDASGSEQRGAGAREGQRTFEEFASARGVGRPAAAAATTHVSVSPRPVAASLPGRLHTFA